MVTLKKLNRFTSYLRLMLSSRNKNGAVFTVAYIYSIVHSF